MIRTAFLLPDRHRWTGGYQYFVNMFRVLERHGRSRVQPVVFVSPDCPDEDLLPLRSGVAEVVRARWAAAGDRTPIASVMLTGFDRKALSAYRENGIQVVFESAVWHGWRFPLPQIAWLPDFQHRRLAGMFSRRAWLQREIGFRAQVASSASVMLSSESARQDCESLYPRSTGKTSVIPFAVEPEEEAYAVAESEVRQRYDISGPYFYLPNQYWRHKNHALIVKALHLLRQQHPDVMVVASGASVDPRHPKLFDSLVEQVHRLGLDKAFRFLRLVPRADVYALMRGSIAVINPSLFEGWSTTVEESKAIGVPMVLSGIAVHREQTGGAAQYFDPASVEDAAAALARAIDAGGQARTYPCITAQTANAQRLTRFASGIESLIDSLAGSVADNGPRA